ncbi:MAG: hypothetical protein ACM30G_18835 [Micromonosporaceae bacterium]
MTPPSSYPDPSTYDEAPGSSPDHWARQATGALREAGALVLLGGNAVFLLLGFFALFLVVDSWADGFGARADANFPRFLGLVAVGFPLLAVLLATHLAPVLARARLITLIALCEYAVSGFLGLIGFIGRFAGRLDAGTGATGPGVRSAFDGLFDGIVWFGLLSVAALAVYKVWLALFYVPRTYPGYPHTYGQPYPGQPSYPGQPAAFAPPAPTFQAGYARLPQPPGFAVPTTAGSPVTYPTSGAGGWPAVPPPPMPAALPPTVPRVPVIGLGAPPAGPPVAPPAGPPVAPPARPLVAPAGINGSPMVPAAAPPAAPPEPTKHLPPEPPTIYLPPTSPPEPPNSAHTPVVGPTPDPA